MPCSYMPQDLCTQFHLLIMSLLSFSAWPGHLSKLSSKVTSLSLIFLFLFPCAQGESQVTSCVFLTIWELVHSHSSNSEHLLSTISSVSRVSTHSVFTTIILTILQMRKRRDREVKKCISVTRNSKWHSRPRQSGSRVYFFNHHARSLSYFTAVPSPYSWSYMMSISTSVYLMEVLSYHLYIPGLDTVPAIICAQ